ncbi:hypothetical protein [Haladaptatus sp. T7]|uniref:hypothetical protein n=1 Tax=Haladaptatus sp. T7 TaxID=2029368 RepID=UPI0021A25552|nr:hypothetical protein [Haladaptatus sp. T7]GKZ13970.1 hypothetical protein HAL_18510 [Haladaptatus sp. T7]
MNRRRAVGALCVLFAVAFAANTLWLVPDGNGLRYEYRTVELDHSHTTHYVRHSSSVQDCSPRLARTCGFEFAAIHGGVSVGANFSRSWPDYDYIQTRNGFYEPTVEVENGTTVLTARNVSFATVLANVTYDPDSATSRTAPELRTAIRTGHVRTRSEIPRPLRFLNESGTYYYLRTSRVGPAHPFLGPKLFAIRILLWLATVPLSVVGVAYWYD